MTKTETGIKCHAIRAESTGDETVLHFKEIELAPPQPHEVRVKIMAAGINFIDIYERRGHYPVPTPYTVGREGAGTIDAVGSAVKDFKPGDRVAFCAHRSGAYSQYANICADLLIPLPDALSFEQGAAFPLQGMTAHYLIFEFYKIEPGSTVLIHAAAGGMGLLLCQWAHHLGAKVIGTTSSNDKAILAQEAGCDKVIIYTSQDFVQECKDYNSGKGVDYIIDGVGKTTFPMDLEAVRMRGHIAIFGSASGRAEPISPNILQQKSITLHGGSLGCFMQDGAEMRMRANAVLEGIERKWLNLRIGETFPLQLAGKAQSLLETRQTTGKVILTVDH